ncbi:hypothetical protein BDV97DRAFT_360853 [Delphinella strobiligena]|nr:hypothetical protein BDV97DRAFT_360853 [Delphinella strobiligena]
MDRTSQQRDMVFCHECENEWYRDEYGLTCPDCSSDFTEIIEPQHDPREELLLGDEDDDDLPSLQNPFHNHDPWAHQDSAPDPDEDDISQWQANGPGRMSFQFTRNLSANGRPLAPGDPMAANPLYQSFATMLNGIMGGVATPPHAASPARPAQPAQPDQANQVNQDNRGTAPGTRVYQGGGPGFTWTASTRVFPGDGNNAQTPDLTPFLNQLFAGGGTARGGGGPAYGDMNPLGLLNGLLNPANMQHGDAVYSQEAMDRIISQLMEQHTSGNAPGPATAEAIANLPQKTISASDLDDQGKADCSICMETVHVGEKVTVLPCSHWFHGECIKLWLGEHDTCPHCRSGIMAKDGPENASAPRNPDQAPRNDVHRGQGTSAAPNPDNAGGLLGRMRNAFGGGGGGPASAQR